MVRKVSRKLVVVALIIVVGVGAVGLSVYGGWNNGVPSDPSASDVLCPQATPPEVDFTVLNDVYTLFRQESVYQSQVSKPDVLLKGALKTIFGFVGVNEKNIPDWANQMVDQQIASGQVDFSVIQKVYERMAQDPAYSVLQNPQRRQDLFESAVNGIIKAIGDPFASYYNADVYRSGASDSTGKYEGIGVSTRDENNETIITTVFAGSPAEKAGLKSGDVITKVDGKSIEGCSRTQLTQKIRGEAGTTVVITVRRLSGTVEDVPVVRGQIRQNVVSSCPGASLPDGRGNSTKDLPFDCPLVDKDGNFVQGVLYIKMNEFTEQVPRDFAAILQGVPRQNYARGIIIDLRGNPGGLVQATLETIDYFLPAGTTVLLQEDKSGVEVPITYQNYDLAIDVPVVVLVGRDPQNRQGAADNSYSASEVFSGSLRDNGRAVIIGESATGGKGTVNRTYPLRNGKYGALYIAIGLWKTPNGDFIERIDTDGDGYKETGGLMPDILVTWTDEDYATFAHNPEWDPVLYRAIDELLP